MILAGRPAAEDDDAAAAAGRRGRGARTRSHGARITRDPGGGGGGGGYAERFVYAYTRDNMYFFTPATTVARLEPKIDRGTRYIVYVYISYYICAYIHAAAVGRGGNG